MNRREWLKRAGLGSLALASLPTILTTRVTPAWAAGAMTMNFHFSATSYIPGQSDRLVMGGSGRFTGKFSVGEVVEQGHVDGEGSFAHYNGSQPGPDNIISHFTGTWKATRFLSFELVGLYGTDAAGNYPLAAGVLDMEIVLVRPGNPSRVPSRLTLVSNLDPAGFNTGQPDGITLLAPNQPGGFLFVPIEFESVRPGPGEAFVSVLISTLDERRRGVAPAQ